MACWRTFTHTRLAGPVSAESHHRELPDDKFLAQSSSLGGQARNYVLSDNPTTQTKFIQSAESMSLEHSGAARVRECGDLLAALAWLLDNAAFRAGKSKSAFLLLEIPGSSTWYQHQKGRKRITHAKYRQYQDALCDTHAEREALDEHWRVYRARHYQPDPPRLITPGPNDPSSDVSVTSQRLDRAISLAEESATLRLSRPKALASPSPSLVGHLPLRADEPRQIITTLVQLGIACNGQASDAVSFFVANQDSFQKAAADLARFGPTAVDEVTLAQSVSSVLRSPSLRPEDRQFWDALSEQLDHRLADEDEWLYRLRHQLPTYASTSPAIWRMQHQRARHFLNALQARAVRPMPGHTRSTPSSASAPASLAPTAICSAPNWLPLPAAPRSFFNKPRTVRASFATSVAWATLTPPEVCSTPPPPTPSASIPRSLPSIAPWPICS